jgi:hypothetical protein
MRNSFTDSDTLGQFTEQEPDAIKALATLQASHVEELRAAYERIKTLESDLEECLEYFKNNYDVVDGDDGEQSPNKEMRLGCMIQETLHGPGNF